MFTGRRSERPHACLAVVLALVAIPGQRPAAQVAGEVLVGQQEASLAAVVRPPDAPGPADQLTEPRALVLPRPVYPRAARAARQEGRVMVCFTLDERGRVLAPAVRASSDEVFNQPVLEAIRGARFTPARVADEPVRSTACRTFRFLLR